MSEAKGPYTELAAKIVKIVEKKRDECRKDKRATAAYWNADDWGSISGVRDALEWIEDEVAKSVARSLRRLIKKHGGSSDSK